MLMPSIFGENLFDDFFDDFAAPSRRIHYTIPTASAMKTDVKEKKDSFELDIDLPGYDKKDVKAELKDGYMTITAAKDEKKEDKDKDGKYLRRERYYGSCSRSFYVGEEVTEQDIKAKFNNGILTVTIPKKEPQKTIEQSKTIAIEG